MTDQDIINEFNILNHSHNKFAWFLFHSNQEIKDYIHNRYNDSNSDKESLQRILNHIDTIPTCPICGNKNIYIGRPNRIYSKYCCNKCKFKDVDLAERHKQGCLKKYGVENISQVDEVKQRKEETFLKHYGVKNNFGRQETIETIKTKYGVNNVSKSIIVKKKKEETFLKHYGVKHYWISEESIKKSHSIEVNKQRLETLRKNGNLGNIISNQEQSIYDNLKKIYPDIVQQYKSNEYPWFCDMYIPKYDLYIEYQGFWTHNDFPYNSKDDKCNKILENWKEKSLNDNFFKSAINCWTISDVNKRNIAKENKLNWIEFFHYDIDLIIKEIENYILELKNNYIGIKTIL